MSAVTVLYLEPLGDIMGGGQRSLLDIVTRLDPQRYHPVVVCGWDGTLAERLRVLGVTVYVLSMPTLKYPWRRAVRQAVEQLEHLVQQEHVALVHANQLRVALYSIQATRRTHVPVLFHARCPLYHQFVGRRWVDRYLATHCRAVVAVSESVATRFRGFCEPSRLFVLYNGTDLDTFSVHVDRTVLRRRFGVADNAPLIGIVGLLEPRRGHTVLIQAFSDILKQYPEAHLLIVGMDAHGYEGYGEYLRRLAVRDGISNHVTFTGFLNEMPLVMGSLDLCVVPGLQEEGFGRVVIEAGAMRCPVVATPLGALRELVEDNVTGLLVPPRDPSALVQAIRKLLDSPAVARQLGAAARQRVEERFALTVMTRRMHQIYDEVIGAAALVA